MGTVQLCAVFENEVDFMFIAGRQPEVVGEESTDGTETKDMKAHGGVEDSQRLPRMSLVTFVWRGVNNFADKRQRPAKLTAKPRLSDRTAPVPLAPRPH